MVWRLAFVASLGCFTTVLSGYTLTLPYRPSPSWMDDTRPIVIITKVTALRDAQCVIVARQGELP